MAGWWKSRPLPGKVDSATWANELPTAGREDSPANRPAADEGRLRNKNPATDDARSGETTVENYRR